MIYEAYCTLQLVNFNLNALIKKAEKSTGVKVNGETNYIKWELI